MVYKHSVIPIVDNTGIKKVKILQIYRHRRGLPGDIILTTVKVKRRAKKYVKKKINNVFLVSVRRFIFRKRGGYFLRLMRNQGVLLGADNEKFLGTRHRSFLTLESKKTAFVQMLRSCRLVV